MKFDPRPVSHFSQRPFHAEAFSVLSIFGFPALKKSRREKNEYFISVTMRSDTRSVVICEGSLSKPHFCPNIPFKPQKETVCKLEKRAVCSDPSVQTVKKSCQPVDSLTLVKLNHENELLKSWTRPLFYFCTDFPQFCLCKP